MTFQYKPQILSILIEDKEYSLLVLQIFLVEMLLPKYHQ